MPDPESDVKMRQLRFVEIDNGASEDQSSSSVEHIDRSARQPYALAAGVPWTQVSPHLRGGGSAGASCFLRLKTTVTQCTDTTVKRALRTRPVCLCLLRSTHLDALIQYTNDWR